MQCFKPTSRSSALIAALLVGLGAGPGAGLLLLPLAAVAESPGSALAATLEKLEARAEANAPAASAIAPTALAAQLPATNGWTGFRRTQIADESNAAMGFRVNMARAEYKEEVGGGVVEIRLSDIGGLDRKARKAIALQDVKPAKDSDFPRNGEIDGLRTEERYDDTTRSGQLRMLIGERVCLDIRGSGVDFERLQAAVKTLDLAAIATLQPPEGG
jgi:hypothetical protein